MINTPVQDGVDEIALALTVDAIPRTMRGAAGVLASNDSIIGKRGLTLMVGGSAAPLRKGDKFLGVPSPPSYPQRRSIRQSRTSSPGMARTLGN